MTYFFIFPLALRRGPCGSGDADVPVAAGQDHCPLRNSIEKHSVGAGFYPARGRGRAPPLRTTRYASVGADAYIGPPGLIPHLLLTVSLRSQCAHWLWQSVLLVPCAKGITDSHDQSADWSRNDRFIARGAVDDRRCSALSPSSDGKIFCPVSFAYRPIFSANLTNTARGASGKIYAFV